MIVIGAIFSFLLGAIIASFSGVVIYRVPNHMSIVKPNSHCGYCNHELKWYDNIPILSYLVLKGKCRYCKEKIGPFYFIIEILGALSFMLAFLQFRYSFDTLFMFGFIWLFIIIGGIDYQNHFVYDSLQIILGILALGYVSYHAYLNGAFPWENLIGLAVGFLSFFLIRVIGGKIMKQECLGMADVILMGTAGLMLGWVKWIMAVLFASVIGSIIEIILLKAFKKEEREIPFCPYLIFGIMLALMYGDVILNFYLGLVM